MATALDKIRKLLAERADLRSLAALWKKCRTAANPRHADSVPIALEIACCVLDPLHLKPEEAPSRRAFGEGVARVLCNPLDENAFSASDPSRWPLSVKKRLEILCSTTDSEIARILSEGDDVAA